MIHIKDFISVVVAIKNEENYIEDCLNSLINQDFSHDLYQIVVVDGMSNDNSVKIINKFKEKHPNFIKFYKNYKEWQSAGRNIAIRNENTSNLIAYIDGHCIADKIQIDISRSFKIISISSTTHKYIYLSVLENKNDY